MKSSRTGQGRIAHHVTNEDTTVAECLKRHFSLHTPRIAQLFALGAIYSDRRRILEDRKLVKGTYLRIHLQPKRYPVEGLRWRSTIVADEAEFLVVDKPAGIPVHATLDNVRDNVLHQLRQLTGHPLLITQRLDVQVAGLFVIAKTPEFQRRFNRWLSERKVKKIYRALVEKLPPDGLHVHYMEPGERSPRKVASDERPGWLRCELLTRAVGDHEVEVELLTGRTHQIRAQLSILGSPIVGDTMYGGVARGENDPIALYSFRLAFPQVGGPPWEMERLPPWSRG